MAHVDPWDLVRFAEKMNGLNLRKLQVCHCTASGLKNSLDFFWFQKTDSGSYFKLFLRVFFHEYVQHLQNLHLRTSDGDFCRSKPFEITPSSFGDGFLRRNSWAWSVFFFFFSPYTFEPKE